MPSAWTVSHLCTEHTRAESPLMRVFMVSISTLQLFRLPKAESNTFAALSLPTQAYGEASNQIVSSVQSLVLYVPVKDAAMLRMISSIICLSFIIVPPLFINISHRIPTVSLLPAPHIPVQNRSGYVLRLQSGTAPYVL